MLKGNKMECETDLFEGALFPTGGHVPLVTNGQSMV